MKRRFARWAAILLAAVLLASCGAKSASGTASYEMASQAVNDAGVEAGGAESALLPEGTTATEETAQKIIYRASLRMESTDFDTARDTLLTAVEATGAWIESSQLSGRAEDADRYANYTVRVPADRYRDFLEQAGQSGNVLGLDENAENVTSSYIDLEARITSLENQRDRLNELAAQAETTADLLEIENRLSDVQYQLESYTQQQRALDGQITYSTVEISLSEVASLTPTGGSFAQRLSDAFAGGWHGFVLFLQGLVLTLVYLWPLVLVAVVVVILIRALARRHRAKSPRPPKGTPPAPPAPPAGTPSDAKPEAPTPKY